TTDKSRTSSSAESRSVRTNASSETAARRIQFARRSFPGDSGSSPVRLPVESRPAARPARRELPKRSVYLPAPKDGFQAPAGTSHGWLPRTGLSLLARPHVSVASPPLLQDRALRAAGPFPANSGPPLPGSRRSD